jgi:HTH-type transcriptional regulator/antitoxin HigA
MNNTIKLTQKTFKNMKPTTIKTDLEYQTALAKLNQIFDAPVGTTESDEADQLALMIEEYEDRYFPIDAPDSSEVIKI